MKLTQTAMLVTLPLSLCLLLAACGSPATPQPAPEASVVEPFLNTAAVAKSLGGSLEWRKMEGVAYHPASRTLYIAVSVIGAGMSDAAGDLQLPANKCGGIFAAQLDSDLSAGKLTPILLGKPLASGGCDEAGLSEPDNLFVDRSGRLWIGEDTSNHANNMLWVYEPAGKTLKRFATLPRGAEVTGLRVADDGTLFMNVQHPDAGNPAPWNAGTIGVVSGIDANTASFSGLPVPTGADQLTVKTAAGTYTVLGQSGQPLPGDARGLKYGEVRTPAGETMLTCDDPDANMFLPSGSDTGTLYTHFECQPGGVVQSELKKVNGAWQTVKAGALDFRAVGGTWNNCNGSVTPWGTALTSEEYPSETDADWAKAEPGMSRYLGKKANRYDLGRISELTRNADGSTQIVKHYAMGRSSWEMGLVLPDRKTVYFGDDGTDRGLYKFVADRAGELSSGTLYVARVAQMDDAASANGKSLNLTWLKLGRGVDSEIQAAVRKLD